MRARALMAAICLVIATNAVALVGVLLNRTGEPDATIELTERELTLDQFEREESSPSLRLQSAAHWWTPWNLTEGFLDRSWFDQAKLEELGFDCRTPLSDPSAELVYGKARRREVFVVLEYEGDAWRKLLASAERDLEMKRGNENYLQEQVESMRRQWSRLLPIDAGLDPAALRVRYPDRGRNLIVRAVVDLRFHAETKESPASISGEILEILADKIYVPLAQRRVLESILAGAPRDMADPHWSPRYNVTVRFGRRHEPWVMSVAPHSD